MSNYPKISIVHHIECADTVARVLYHGNSIETTVTESGWGDSEPESTLHLRERLVNRIAIYKAMLDAVNKKAEKDAT